MKKGKFLLKLATALAAVTLGLVTVTTTPASAKTVTFGTTGVSYPTSYKKGKQLTGYDVAVTKAASKKLGYKVKYKTTSFGSLFGQLDSHKVDGIASNLAITPQRKQKYLFSRSYADLKYGVAVSKKSKIKNINQLRHKTLGATEGSLVGPVMLARYLSHNKVSESVGDANVKQAKKYINIKTYDDRESVINAVNNGQVDGYVNAEAVFKATIKHDNLPLKLISGHFGGENIGLAFNKNSKGRQLQKNYNKALQQLQKDGTLSRLSKKYFAGDDVTR